MIEIAEHMENPRHLFREAVKLLRSRETIIITTPNIENPLSLALLLMAGHFQWFNDENYRNNGHISLLSQWILKKCLVESSLDLVEEQSFGDPFRGIKWRKLRMLGRLIQGLILRSSRYLTGEIYVLVGQRAA
jgi:hypothetical protein